MRLNWEIKNKHYINTSVSNLFPYSKEVEDFLIKTQTQLDELSLKVLHFFNEEDENKLVEKIEKSNLLMITQ
jgi:hypothetical protein